MFYIYVFHIKFPEGDIKNIETCYSISGLYVDVYVLMFGRLFIIIILYNIKPSLRKKLCLKYLNIL